MNILFFILTVIFTLVSLAMIAIILVQRPQGGGLAGAFGGAGGGSTESVFGGRVGDALTIITVIAFVGSVFSSYYALARARGRADPHNHCAINVSLWHDGRRGWSFTERGRDALRRDAHSLRVGASRLRWDGSELVIDLDALNWPRLGRIRGRLRVMPPALTSRGIVIETGSPPLLSCTKSLAS